MTLEQLRERNPQLPLFSVSDPAFQPYGRVLSIVNSEQLRDALNATEIPSEGNRYVASVPSPEATDAVREVCSTVYGGMPIQAGFCNGKGFALNAEEYHKCSEVNFTTTGLVLLLALPEDIHDGVLSSDSVKGFFLPPDTAVELHPRVLHFAPCRIREDGFNCLVVLTRGTNEPLLHIDPNASGEAGLLWMQNKWLIAHPDSPQAKNGAHVGIAGENIKLSIH